MPQPYTPGTQIKIRKPCPDCVDGWVELPGSGMDFSVTVIKQYHMGYCPTCGGQKYLEMWTSLETIYRWLAQVI